MRLFTTLYLLLLLYIIAALVFWGYSLNKQSERIYELEKLHLSSQMDSLSNSLLYQAKLQQLQEKKDRRRHQYLGEGSTFLAVIFIGAAIVYTSFRRNIRLSRQQNNFMLSVTHELKSPIAAIKLNLQTLEKYNLDEEKKHLLIEKCIREANRLNDLCSNMLFASQMEGGQYISVNEEIELSKMVADIIQDYTTRFPGRLSAQIENKDIRLWGDHFMLRMALHNLIENALKYSEKLVEIQLYTQSRQIYFRVLDQGPGIPDNEKPFVFRKFYRIGDEKHRKAKGTGLGLYLTRKIVEQHKGKIWIKDNQPTGAVFELILPISVKIA